MTKRQIFGNNVDNLKDITDMIYDTLCGNTQYPQFPAEKLENQYVDADIGLIELDFGNFSYIVQITKKVNE